MSVTVIGGRKQSDTLPAQWQLTVTAAALSSGSVVRMADSMGGPPQGVTPLAAGETVTIGPFATVTRHEVVCDTGSLTYSSAAVDYPSASEATAAAVAAAAALYIPVVVGTIGDVGFYVGAGAPVDYTDGTPPATGEGVAGISSLYFDTTNGKIYVNGGTKAHPVWKLVTSAS